MNQAKTLQLDFLVALSVSILFCIFNYLAILNGHFNEDAYILFIYAENLANGHGITYYQGGPPLEGATDFLWMVILAGLVKLGLAIGSGVLLLNAVAVFVMSYLLSRLISQANIKDKYLLWLVYPLVFLWIFNQLLYAATGGFSVFLYMALVLMAFVSVHKEKYVLTTPYLAIIIALFRPDGVIIGVGFTLVGLYIAHQKQQLKPYLIGCMVGLVIGISYFVWRYNYFGHLLPLPLYVKSAGSFFSGIGQNLKWGLSNFYLLLPMVLLAFLNKQVIKYVFLAAPVIVLFVVLFTAAQTQNVGYRFQAPLFIVAYYIFVVLIIEYLSTHTVSKVLKIGFIVYLIGFMVLGLGLSLQYPISMHWPKFVRSGSFHQAAIEINKVLPDGAVIALTEAGRVAYYNQTGGHTIIDLIGLNTEYPAKNTIDVRYIEGLSPDMLMYLHINETAAAEWSKDDDSNVVLLADKDKKLLVQKDKDGNFISHGKKYSAVRRTAGLISKSTNGQLSAAEYLQKDFDDYDIFVVDYHSKEKSSFFLVYAFKKTLGLRDKIATILNDSYIKTRLTYYELQGQLVPFTSKKTTT